MAKIENEIFADRDKLLDSGMLRIELSEHTLTTEYRKDVKGMKVKVLGVTAVDYITGGNTKEDYVMDMIIRKYGNYTVSKSGIIDGVLVIYVN